MKISRAKGATALPKAGVKPAGRNRLIYLQPRSGLQPQPETGKFTVKPRALYKTRTQFRIENKSNHFPAQNKPLENADQFDSIF